jgi:hypothetical protein
VELLLEAVSKVGFGFCFYKKILKVGSRNMADNIVVTSEVTLELPFSVP